MKTLRRSFIPALLLLCWIPPSTARGQDDWLGADKVLHFVANLAITTVTYSVAVNTWDMEQDQALALGVGVSSAVSVAKELYDLHTDGHFSGKDLVWDALGMGTAVVLVKALDERSERVPSGGGGGVFLPSLRALSGPLTVGNRVSLRFDLSSSGGSPVAPYTPRLNPIDTPLTPFSLVPLRRNPPGD